jgi:hypothetical protein
MAMIKNSLVSQRDGELSQITIAAFKEEHTH